MPKLSSCAFLLTSCLIPLLCLAAEPGVRVPEGDEIAIGINRGSGYKLSFASLNGAFVRVNEHVLNLADKSEVGRLVPPPANNVQVALAPDGKLAALLSSDVGVQQIYDVAKPEASKPAKLKFDRDRVSYVWGGFSGPTTIVCVGRIGSSNGTVRTMDATTGEQTGDIRLSKIRPRGADLSPDGRRLVILGHGSDGIEIELATGAVTTLPTLPGEVAVLRYSPDGSELAALVANETRGGLLVTIKGQKITSDFEIAPVHVAAPIKPDQIQFLPDGSGWMVFESNYAYFVDRSAKRVLWTQERNRKYSLDYPMVLNNRQWLITGGKDGKPAAVSQPLPRAEFDAATKKLANPAADAILKPGDTVSIDIQASNMRFGAQEEAVAFLREKMTRRLENSGFKVGEGAKAVLRVNYLEDTPADPRTLAGQQGKRRTLVTWTLTAAGVEKPLFSLEKTHFPEDYNTSNDKGPAQMRKGLFRYLGQDNLELHLPTYVEPSGYVIPLTLSLLKN